MPSHLRSLIRRLGARFLIALAALGPMPDGACGLPENVQIHGFLSQGYILTTGNNFFGETIDGGAFDFRELGLNGSWRVTPSLQISLQALSRSAGETDDGRVRLDYGFIDYTFLTNTQERLGVRLGRILNPFGLYSDTRDVAFIRPSVLLPQSIYFDVNRGLAVSSDGAQLYLERHAEIGDFTLQVGPMRPRVEDPDLEQAIIGPGLGRLEPELSWIGRLSYETNAGRLRLMLTGAQVNVRYDPGGFADPFESGRFRFEPLILSVQYNARYWDLTAEYARRSASLIDFGPVFPDVGSTGESYYLQGTYRFAPHWEALLRYDVLYWDKTDRNGTAFAAATGQPGYRRYAKDLTVGLRWDVTPSFMLRTELHYIDGTGWFSELENPFPLETERYWTLFALFASYRF